MKIVNLAVQHTEVLPCESAYALRVRRGHRRVIRKPHCQRPDRVDARHRAVHPVEQRPAEPLELGAPAELLLEARLQAGGPPGNLRIRHGIAAGSGAAQRGLGELHHHVRNVLQRAPDLALPVRADVDAADHDATVLARHFHRIAQVGSDLVKSRDDAQLLRDRSRSCRRRAADRLGTVCRIGASGREWADPPSVVEASEISSYSTHSRLRNSNRASTGRRSVARSVSRASARSPSAAAVSIRYPAGSATVVTLSCFDGKPSRHDFERLRSADPQRCSAPHAASPG